MCAQCDTRCWQPTSSVTNVLLAPESRNCDSISRLRSVQCQDDTNLFPRERCANPLFRCTMQHPPKKQKLSPVLVGLPPQKEVAIVAPALVWPGHVSNPAILLQYCSLPVSPGHPGDANTQSGNAQCWIRAFSTPLSSHQSPAMPCTMRSVGYRRDAYSLPPIVRAWPTSFAAGLPPCMGVLAYGNSVSKLLRWWLKHHAVRCSMLCMICTARCAWPSLLFPGGSHTAVPLATRLQRTAVVKSMYSSTAPHC